MLSEIIIEKIKQDGPISFRDYMEMCLYYPELGYYTSAPDKIGRKGDYYTSSFLTPAFGAAIGQQLEEMWQVLGENPFTVVEYGAGPGLLCHDILMYVKNNPKFYGQLSYHIIEKSAAMRNRQKALLNEKVSWFDRIEDIGEINGCVLSNEVVDNFSVHQVVMKDALMEVFVDYQQDFQETLVPANKALTDYFIEMGVQLSADFRTEVNLEATEWIQNIASALKTGYVMTIDYGYTSSELYKDSRRTGTLLCYHEHTVNDSPYKDAGKQDITAHINFSALCRWGFKKRLMCCGLTNQADLLLKNGFRDHLITELGREKNILQAARMAASITQNLLLEMGAKIKVLIQQKGLPKHQQRMLRCLS